MRAGGWRRLLASGVDCVAAADGAAAPGPAAIGLLVLSSVLPLVMLVGVFARGCQAPHDVFARTAVVPAR